MTSRPNNPVDDLDGMSDESDFYGDASTRARLETRVGLGTKRALSSLQHSILSSKGLKLDVRGKNEKITDRQPHSSLVNTKRSENVAVPVSTQSRKAHTRPKIGDEAVGHLTGIKSDQNSAAWQDDESLDDFMHRLPVASPETSTVGPWLWVNDAHLSIKTKQVLTSANIDAFLDSSQTLLTDFRNCRTRIEAEHDGKAPATITRHLNPHRDRLEKDLLDAALQTGTTCGKWMLFPNREELQRSWRLVADATRNGKLGPTAKVATRDPTSERVETLICVYTYNFADLDDVKRVLGALIELDLFTPEEKTIYYKCDAYTYLGIQSDNPWRLRASLFSSKEVLNDQVQKRWILPANVG